MKNFIKKIIRFFVPVILLIFLLQTITSNWQEVLLYFKNFRILPLVFSFGLLLLIYPESALAWYMLTKKIGVKISFKNALYLWIISNTSRYIPGTIWQYIGRIELGQQIGIARKEGMLAVFYETFLTIISGGLVSFFALSYWAAIGIKPYIIIIGLIITLIFIHPRILNSIFLSMLICSNLWKPYAANITKKGMVG